MGQVHTGRAVFARTGFSGGLLQRLGVPGASRKATFCDQRSWYTACGKRQSASTPTGNFFYLENAATQPLFEGPEHNPWPGLLALTMANLSVFTLWHYSNDDSHRDFMFEHFAVNATNLNDGRYWTLITACFSHDKVGHFFSNMCALWLFGFKVHRVLNTSVGMPVICWLYFVCGFSGSIAHVAANLVGGRVDVPLTAAERRMLEPSTSRSLRGWLEQSKEQARKRSDARVELAERLSLQDTPSLGASGAIFGIAATCAALFPKDKVRLQYGPVPIPVAIGVFAVVDTARMAAETLGSEGNGVAHAAHLGGMLTGAACAACIWCIILPRLGRAQAGALPIVAWFRENSMRSVFGRS